MGTLAALRTKIDEEPLNTSRTDEEVLAWLGELEQGPFVDVSGPDYFDWCAEYRLPGYLYAAAQVTPMTNAGSASHMLHTAWLKGEALQTSSTAVRNHLADAVPSIVSTEARTALLAIARPDVARYVNAGWDTAPILGDVVAARNLP